MPVFFGETAYPLYVEWRPNEVGYALGVTFSPRWVNGFGMRCPWLDLHLGPWELHLSWLRDRNR